MRCSYCGEQIQDGSIFCFKCGKKVNNDFVTQMLEDNYTLINTSGQGSYSAIPEEIKGWSWGACLLNLIWGIYHGVYKSLLFFIPGVNIFMFFWFGLNGNKLAWQNHRWESIEQFRRTQRKWSQWGVVLWLTMAFITLLVAAYTFDVEDGLGMIGIWILYAFFAVFFVKLMEQKRAGTRN
jgi:hypothetical protein